MLLRHYSCSHARTRILKDMTLRATDQSYGHLIWLTDLERPDVLALGLTSFMLRCDRTEYRITVETDQAVPWTEWAHDNHVPLPIRLGLDGNPGAQPRRWWVSTSEIPVLGIEPTFAKAKRAVKAP